MGTDANHNSVIDSADSGPAPTEPIPAPGRSRTFFVRGLKALLPTLITISLILWIWNFLWEQLGRHLIWLIQNVQYQFMEEPRQWGRLQRDWMSFSEQTRQWEWNWWAQLLGVSLSLLLVYFVGLLVGNLIGRTFWALGESVVMKIPIIRAIYPAVKQVTDFVLQERTQLAQKSRVVACRPHESGIWSIGLVTGEGVRPLDQVSGEEMVTVFVPSSPTAFSGYVMIVPRSQVVELPMKVEEAMRLLVSGGVLTPPEKLGHSLPDA